MSDMPSNEERDEKLGREIAVIVSDRRGEMLRELLHQRQREAAATIQPAAPPVQETVDPPAVTQVRRLKVTRKPVPELPDLEKVTPEQRVALLRRRWKRTGTPFIGRRQIERAQRQAAKHAPPASGFQDVLLTEEKTHATDLMACPRCNQYNQRTNYACRVCGYEFGIST